MKSGKRFVIGGLGALAPIAVVVVTVDLATIINNVDSFEPVHYIFFFGRYGLLFLIGGFIAYLYKDEDAPLKLFQIGIAAPAIISSLAAGGAFGDIAQGKILESQKEMSISTERTWTEIQPIQQWTVVLTYPDNNFEKYTVNYNLEVSISEIEVGTPAIPLRAKFSDVRSCRVTLTSAITRNVHLLTGGRVPVKARRWSATISESEPISKEFGKECRVAFQKDVRKIIDIYMYEFLVTAPRNCKRDIVSLQTTMEKESQSVTSFLE